MLVMRPFANDALTDRIIYGVIRVHQRLGPGFLEVVYRRALVLELRKQGLHCETEKEILVYYDGVQVGRHVLDLVVDGRVIVETKAVEALNKAHYAQARAYLKATGLSVAILANFGEARADFRRVVLP
jgi:GxxExxY protein